MGSPSSDWEVKQKKTAAAQRTGFKALKLLRRIVSGQNYLTTVSWNTECITVHVAYIFWWPPMNPVSTCPRELLTHSNTFSLIHQSFSAPWQSRHRFVSSQQAVMLITYQKICLMCEAHCTPGNDCCMEKKMKRHHCYSWILTTSEAKNKTWCQKTKKGMLIHELKALKLKVFSLLGVSKWSPLKTTCLILLENIYDWGVSK